MYWMLLSGWAVFILVDLLAYAKTPLRYRMNSWLYLLPGGGLWAYFSYQDMTA